MGLDTESLDSQVAEHQSKILERKRADVEDRLRNEAIDRILESAMKEENQIRFQQMQELKRDWLALSERKKSEILGNDPIDLDSCGPGAAQKFAGEDRFCHERSRHQKEQMRRWIQEKLAENAYQEAKEKEATVNYASYIRTMDEILSASHAEEKEMQRKILRDTADYNNHIAMEKARKKAEDRQIQLQQSADEISATMSLSLMVENVGEGVTENGKILRRDAFKGFSSQQRKKAMEENLEQIRLKREAEALEKRSEDEYARQQYLTKLALDKAFAEEEARKEQDKLERLAFLKKQMEEQSNMRTQSKNARFGSVDPNDSLYAKFGMSIR